MKRNWNDIETKLDFEEQLFQQTKIIISKFSEQVENLNKTFYAFAFDIEIEQGHFGLCFNNLEALCLTKAQFENTSDNFNGKEFEYAFSTGNWKYQSFNKFGFPVLKQIWDSKMKSIISAIFSEYEEIEYDEGIDEYEKIVTTDKLHQGFINSIEKVLGRIKSGNIFKSLKTTDNFSVYYLEFHDDLEDKIIKKRIKTATNIKV